MKTLKLKCEECGNVTEVEVQPFDQVERGLTCVCGTPFPLIKTRRGFTPTERAIANSDLLDPT